MAVVYRAPSTSNDSEAPGSSGDAVAEAAPRLPPLLPGALPVLGHALGLRRNPVELVQRGRDLFGDIFRLELPGSTGVVMTGLAAQEKYFRLSDDDVSQAEAYQLMTPIFGKGMAYDAPPPVMKEQLGFFHAALRESRLRTYTEGFAAEATSFFGDWPDDGEVDMYEVGNELTIYTSTRSLLGNRFRAELSSEFAELYQEMEAGLNLVAFINPYLPLPSFRRRDRARAKMGSLISNIVARRRADGEGDEDFLQTLMEARYSDGRKLTDDEMTGLLLAIMFAGHHTSGVTFSWTGVLLAQHPEIVRRLREEQTQVLGDKASPDLDDLRAMPLLEATIKEVLRMYPPIILVMRKVINGFSFQDYDVVPGDMIFACPAVAHNIPEVFRDPHRFDPDRFMPDRAEDKQSPMGWLAFGAGRHRCMGIVFAILQLKALWSHLLRNFDFELGNSVYEPDYSRLLVGPRQPCKLRFRRRASAKRARASAEHQASP